MISIPGKIPIQIYPLFWVLALMIGWINSQNVLGTAIWVVVIVISVIIHEFGHALTALAFGQKAHIELVALGGATERQGPKLKLWQEFIIVFDGPLAGLALFALSYIIRRQIGAHESNLFTAALDISIFVNLFWTVINLFPVLPLDGGRLLSIVLEGIFGVRGVKMACLISLLLALTLGILLLSTQFFLAGALFLLLAYESYQGWKSIQIYSETDRNVDMQGIMHAAEEDMRRGEFENALSKLRTIRSQSKSGMLFNVATQYMAQIMAREGSYKEAYGLLKTLPPKSLREMSLLMHQLAYRTKDWEAALLYGEKAYREKPSREIALTNAFCCGLLCLLCDTKPAVGWLRSAQQQGSTNIRDIVDRPEFDKIRNDPVFKDFVSGI
jgi:Zn-dependent protease